MADRTTHSTILLHLPDVGRVPRLLDAAVPLARAAGAHLIALAVVPPFVVVPAMDATGVTVTVENHREAFRADAKRMKELFAAATSDLTPTPEWREADAKFESVALRILEQGRCSDLIVVPQIDPNSDGSTLQEDPVRIVMESGRPVLMLPNEGAITLPPKRVMVAFDGRREAARAIFDALPLLQRADNVSVAWLNASPATAGDLPVAEICATLARHGVKSQGLEGRATGADVGVELLRLAKADGADLLVMGCYGHSRLREFILGGATRHILHHMHLPVLLSH
jgi:nucleotide-binding universal stress UspA family protein